MTPTSIIFILLAYFALLIVIARLTSRNADGQSFYLGNKKSPWYIVAFGMIGASLSGVTFISVPGWVEGSQFSYMQMVLGYLVGYLVIGTVLLPLYYKLNLSSIYGYLLQRLGWKSYKTGSAYFLLSRIIGASFRLYLVAMVLEDFVLVPLGVPKGWAFIISVIITVALIWIYTNRGGIKTIIWTDTLQTFCLIAAAIAAFVGIANSMDFSFGDTFDFVANHENSRIFFFDDLASENHFIKKFLAGAFIAIAMTGLDQDMMQKNLSCKNIGDAQKNMFWFSIILVPVNLLFLGLGVLLYAYAAQNGMAVGGDQLFPTVALDGSLGAGIALFFVVGLIASAYSSADSALTALTTSFCVDILGTERKRMPEQAKKSIRQKVHIGMSVTLIFVILIFKLIDDRSIIDTLFKVASYTYGPLLGLYVFGLFTKRGVKDMWVPIVCILAPVVCLIINYNSVEWFDGFKFGHSMMLINGAFTFIFLMMISTAKPKASLAK